MSLKVNLVFCFCFVLWTSSVSGINYIVHGDWRVEVTISHKGKDNSILTDIIDDPTMNNLGYDFFDANAVVVAGVNITVKVDPPDAVTTNNLVLCEYQKNADSKVYEGQFSIDSFKADNPQTAQVIIALIISREGVLTIKNYVQVEIFGYPITYPMAQSHMHTLKIAK